jgi:superfamily II DNA/RNA helicase/very-short-patch-repair endonuclease
MDVFKFRELILDDYKKFTRSFTKVQPEDIKKYLNEKYDSQLFWPEPLIQLNPRFVSGQSVDEMVDNGRLHPECAKIFRVGKQNGNASKPLQFHKHQEEAIDIAQHGHSYVLTTGTGSGKSLSYFVPIIDHVLRKRDQAGTRKGITAIVIYPMNALANSQMDELEKYLKAGYPSGGEPVTFGRYTGQENTEERQAMAANPPDILLTNFMMLELIMTRQNEDDKAIVRHAQGLEFLVLDELHTYRGRQGADVALLVRRVREAFNPDLLCVGTSATMASEGDLADRNQTVAQVAGKLFGRRVDPSHVITETLSRITTGEVAQPENVLRATIEQGLPIDLDFKELQRHPVAIWVETTLGLKQTDGRWERAEPRSLDNASRLLSEASGLDAAICQDYLRDFLLLCQQQNLFAFRLHQFISGAGNLYATLEPAGKRYIDLSGQQVQPGHRHKRLFNMAFCRQCGQEYHTVWALYEHKTLRQLEPRELDERTRSDDEDEQFGLFMPDPLREWDDENLDKYPELWLDHSGDAPRLKPHFRNKRPQSIQVATDGTVGHEGMRGWFIPGNMPFCLSCGFSYHTHSKESARLASLSGEGRSSATTVLTLSALRHMLLEETDLPEAARKLLCFTDNRQDASLQAGHFNDTIQVLLLRSAVLAAAREMEKRGGRLSDHNLTQEVFKALGFDRDDPEIRREYMSNPEAMGPARRRAEDAMRDVLGYRLYNDLRRGWRFTNPNLEQLELLKIGYEGLDDLVNETSLWSKTHPLLANAQPDVRQEILLQLLDVMRQSLCIKTRYLDRVVLEQILQASHNYLREPWGFTEDERPEQATYLVPGPRSRQKDFQVTPLSGRSKFGKELKKPSTWGNNADYPAKFDESTFQQILTDLLDVLEHYGLIESSKLDRGRTGYQIVADTLEWRLNASKRSSDEQPKANVYFRALYENISYYLKSGDNALFRLEAREHTAQVDQEDRQEREERFRKADLPVLFCSPTMELGVDIAELNTVYLRNVPPTPANYAQRSGRAGRSGQPALVLTYCAARSPHDQYFFSDPVRMVQGQVKPPTLDLANEDLIRSHLNAIWLNETGQKLANSVADILDMEQGDKLPLRTDLIQAMDAEAPRQRTARRAIGILGMLQEELTPDLAPWYHPDWLNQTIRGAFRNFDQSLERWRTLYLATTRQMEQAHQIQLNAAASEAERKEAARRYNEARTQQTLLLQSKPTLNSDFYTYRYLASQGFLPGYNFPRLPLMAFIPARREKVGRDSFLARPRFLAIAEFGPLSVIYHEGSQYRVRRVIIGVRNEEGADSSIGLPTRSVRLCPDCGYGHFGDHKDDERCNACGALLEGGMILNTLYRVENVSARRATRITSDEEDRLRQGYEMQTTLQFATEDGRFQVIKARFGDAEQALLEVQYAPSATVWRINLGWRRRKEKSIYGYNIDVMTGFWAKDAQAPEDEDQVAEKPVSQVQRIVPYVEDRRNILIVRPEAALDEVAMVTLQYALKRGIEQTFQLEEAELMAEPLPNRDQRNAILFYESAEGGAGVLTRLANESGAMQRVARAALEIMHYALPDEGCTPETLKNLELDQCEKGCYRCLLSYYNQPDHTEIDRKHPQVLDLLCRLTRSKADRGTLGRDAEEQMAELQNLSGSSLEQAWLDHVKAYGLRLPDRAQFVLHEFHTRPDFGYSGAQALIYIDGPHHENLHKKALDSKLTQQLENAGFLVIRFPKEQNRWPEIFARHPDIFGTKRE